MSDSTPPPVHDPLTAVLLIVTEIRGDVKSALDRLARHESRLDRAEERLDEHGNRITRLEAVDQRDGEHERRTYSRATVIWSAVGAMAAVVAIFATVLLAKG